MSSLSSRGVLRNEIRNHQFNQARSDQYRCRSDPITGRRALSSL